MLLNTLDFNRDIQDKTGLELKIDESVNQLQGSSAFRPQTQAESAAAPIISIREADYGSSRDFGWKHGWSRDQYAKEVKTEVLLNKGFSVQGVYDNYEDIDTKNMNTSFGADLKWEMRFK